jgi:hypothetical protein
MSQQAHRRSNRLAEVRPEASQPEATVAPPLKPKRLSKKDKDAALQENARIIAQTEDLSVGREYEERDKARQRAQGASKPGQPYVQGEMIFWTNINLDLITILEPKKDMPKIKIAASKAKTIQEALEEEEEEEEDEDENEEDIEDENEEDIQASMGISQPDEFPTKRVSGGSDYSSIHTASPRESPEPDLPMNSDEEWEAIASLSKNVSVFSFFVFQKKILMLYSQGRRPTRPFQMKKRQRRPNR